MAEYAVENLGIHLDELKSTSKLISDMILDINTEEGMNEHVDELMSTLSQVDKEMASTKKRLSLLGDILKDMDSNNFGYEEIFIKDSIDEINQRFEAVVNKKSGGKEKSNYEVLKKKLKAKYRSQKNHGELEIESETVNLTCPITQTRLIDPVKSRVCGHVYSRSAIMTLLKKNRPNSSMLCCPVDGCGQSLSHKDLIEHSQILNLSRTQRK